MPGLLLCFVLRYENHKKAQSTTQPTSSVTYFHCSLIGYLVGTIEFYTFIIFFGSKSSYLILLILGNTFSNLFMTLKSIDDPTCL